MTSQQRSVSASDRSAADLVAPFLAVTAISYNAVLATVNAHLFRMNMGVVILSEIAILGSAILCVLFAGLRRYAIISFLFLAPFVFIALVMSLVNETVFPDAVRNILIISSFTAVGYVIDDRSFRSCFFSVAVIVAAFLLLETAYLAGYAAIFQPAQYLEATRGITPFKYNDTGLFAGALGYDDRFSFGVFNGPRTSSIFLEQVSLAGFAAVFAIYLLGDWRRLGRGRKLFYASLVIGILVTNNTRASSALVIIFLLGYFAFPKTPPRLTFLIAPVVLATAFILVGELRPDGGESDDLIGRLAVTVNDLKEQTAESLLVGSIVTARGAVDSGYVYIVTSSTIFGMLLFWAYVNVMPALETAEQQRVRWAAGIYIWAWLLIGGTAIFSMKTSSLLWLTVGHLAARAAPTRRDERRRPEPPKSGLHRARLAAG